MSWQEYSNWIYYLEHRTPEQFEYDCYRDKTQYYVDRIKRNAGIY
jgi:hypothetical protein